MTVRFGRNFRPVRASFSWENVSGPRDTKCGEVSVIVCPESLPGPAVQERPRFLHALEADAGLRRVAAAAAGFAGRHRLAE